MNLEFSELESQVRAEFLHLLEKESPIERVREAEPLGFDAKLWGLVADAGFVPGIGQPGEVEARPTATMFAAMGEAAGQMLAPIPFAEAVAGGLIVADCGVSCDTGPVVSDWDNGSGQTPNLVPGAAVASHIVRFDDGKLTLFGPLAAAPPQAKNLGSIPVAFVDTSNLGEPRVLKTGVEAKRIHDQSRTMFELIRAAELVGIAKKSLDIGVSYASQRMAFGRVIGSFQAIAHPFADCATAVDGARLLVFEAASMVDSGDPSAARLARMALAFAAETAEDTAATSLHAHGGYGYTIEYDIQLYFRRAKALALIMGGVEHLYAELARDAVETPLHARKGGGF